MDYDKSSHTVHSIQYHIVWITKYRKSSMTGLIAERIRETIRQICSEFKVTIVKGHVSKDHIHLMVKTNPSITISKLVGVLKGRTAYKLYKEFPELKKKYWGQHFWSRGYFVATVGAVTDETIKIYIQNQDIGTPDDDFQVTEN
jgi:putative transposase